MKKEVVLLGILALCSGNSRAEEPLRLFTDTPARQWMTDAYPIGNGYMGAMFYGTPNTDTIQFTHESLWEGGPGSHPDYRGGNRTGAWQYLSRIRELLRAGNDEAAHRLAGEHLTGIIHTQEGAVPEFGDYGAQQNFGSIVVRVGDQPRGYVNYSRELDISSAVGKMEYDLLDTHYKAEYFASYSSEVIAARYENDARRGTNYEIGLDTPHRNSEIVCTDDSTLVLRGKLAGNGLPFEAVVRVRTDGRFSVSAGSLKIRNARYAEVYLTAATGYKNEFPHYRGEAPEQLNRQVLANLETASYARLREEHILQYRELFDRVSLDLGSIGNEHMPTYLRQAKYAGGHPDPGLEALFFQYGRYLLISSSRPGSLPANLQGKWNHSLDPPWASDYHMNINQQMIYWPATLTALPETNLPLIEYILSLREPGAVTAREYFNARGWSVHTMNNPYGYTAPGWGFNWGYAPNAASWLAQHLWEQYAFYPDEEYLRGTAYPVMKELAHFWFDYLTEDIDGTLVSSPSYSPEHGPVSAGATMDQEVAWDLLTNLLEADAVLHDPDREFIDSVRGVRDRLSPLKIGRLGQLQEWKEDIDDPENHHRHVSHLFALHPGRQITPRRTPELAEAARRSLIFRGDDGTGWSLAWKINFWARLLDGNKAYEMSRRVLRPSRHTGASMATGGGAYPNLLCAHPPFQLDGNMGYVSGVAEMLLQSHDGAIDLLPALPDAWPDGEVRGLRARGGFGVDITWREGQLQRAVLTPGQDTRATVRYGDDTREMEFRKDKPVILTY